jgi:hypothetical protein
MKKDGKREREMEVNGVRFEVLTLVRIKIRVFWNMKPCKLVGRYQRFGGNFYLYLHGKRDSK